MRNALLFSSALFPDDILATAEQDILKHENAPSAQGPGLGTFQHSGRKQQQYHYKPYDKKDSRQANLCSVLILKLGDSFPARVEDTIMDGEVEIPLISLNPPVQNSINDNYYTKDPPVQKPLEYQISNSKTQIVDLNVAFAAPYVTGQSQKKDVRLLQHQKVIKCVKPVCCISHCLCIQPVENVQHVVRNPPVGGCLQKFLQVWLSQGSNPRVLSILKEGYSLPFKVRPPLSRSPVIVTGYTDPVRNKHLIESLIAFIQKQAVEKVVVSTSLAFYSSYFWCQSQTTSGGQS